MLTPEYLQSVPDAMVELYAQAEADILAETMENGSPTPHNTVTPILHYDEKKGYVLDLVPRNNRTTEQYPEGIFHPHREIHHIKKENIGLIEVMGLAILPSRLAQQSEAIAAVLCGGMTVIENCAKEPHIVDLANFLNSMGARVKGAGTDVIRIRGMQHLHHCTYTVIPDQIETGTLMIAAAATRGDVTIHGCIPTHMEALTAKLLEMGVRVTENDDSIRVRPQGEQRAVNVKTQVYPGFPTDLQQPMTALLCMAHGTSTVCETIFEQRFKHLDELRRMGAHIKLVDRTVLIEGVRELYGAPVTVTDLRAGAALVVAGLMAKGVTEIYETSYIDRGYERIEEKLRALGAEIRREKI